MTETNGFVPKEESDKEVALQNREISVHKLFELLKAEESRPADPNEKILVGEIKKEDAEYELLIQAGATPEEVKSRNIPREKLLEAGFAFNNYPLPAIEKPLINVEIDGVNFGQRKLLTSGELEEIKRYQRQHPDFYGGEGIATDEFRENMLSFLMSAEPILPSFIENKVNFYRLCISTIHAPYTSREGEDKYKQDKLGQRTNPLYQRLVEMHHDSLITSENAATDERAFIASNLLDVMPWDERDTTSRFPISARGHRMRAIDSRKSVLNGRPSPFIDSGFHFPRSLGNPDFTVVGGNERVFRVNSLVLHLASRGLSEMGEGRSMDGDQDYSIGNFIRDLAPKDEASRNGVEAQESKKFELVMNFSEEELMKAVQGKLKALAVAWANSEAAPPEAKKLAKDIQEIEKNKDRSLFEKATERFRKPRI